jgi:hypothetical protein
MSGSSQGVGRGRAIAIDLDDFGREALEHECLRLGVSEEELVRFAIAYYLADIDSGRIARRIPQGPAESH